MAELAINVETNISSLVTALQNLVDEVDHMAEILAPVIIDSIRRNVFRTLASALIEEAGPGFPRAYRDHLLAFMQLIPIALEVSGDTAIININLEALGNDTDYMAGFHHHAITDGGINFMHPALIELPYEGEALLVEQERREEFWNLVIVNKDIEAFLATGWDYYAPNRAAQMIGALRTILSREDLPSWQEVSARRVVAWVGLGVAPEWILLEYGSASSGVEPSVEPVGFLERIEVAAQCVAESAIQSIENGLLQVFDREASSGRMVSVNAVGRPFFSAGQGAISGRFVTYKDVAPSLTSGIEDVSACLEY